MKTFAATLASVILICSTAVQAQEPSLNLSVTRMSSNPKVADWQKWDDENVRDHFEMRTKKLVESLGYKLEPEFKKFLLKTDLVKTTEVKGSFWFYSYSLTASLIPAGQMEPIAIHTATYELPGAHMYPETAFQNAAKELSESLGADVKFWLTVDRRLNSVK